MVDNVKKMAEDMVEQEMKKKTKGQLEKQFQDQWDAKQFLNLPLAFPHSCKFMPNVIGWSRGVGRKCINFNSFYIFGFDRVFCLHELLRRMLVKNFFLGEH